MNTINDQPYTSGTVIVHPGEQAIISTPRGQIMLKCEHTGEVPGIVFEDGILKLKNFDTPLGSTATFGMGSPAGSMNLRFHIFAASAGDVHVIHFTAVKS